MEAVIKTHPQAPNILSKIVVYVNVLLRQVIYQQLYFMLLQLKILNKIVNHVLTQNI